MIYRQRPQPQTNNGAMTMKRQQYIIPVSVNKNNTPPDKKAGWQICFESTKSETGLQFLLLGRMAKARAKGVFLFTDTGSNDYS